MKAIFCENQVCPNEGFALYRKALELGDTLAYANLGYCYETGQGVPADPEKARKYYEAGAALGEEHCIERLANLNRTLLVHRKHI